VLYGLSVLDPNDLNRLTVDGLARAAQSQPSESGSRPIYSDD
jgi:hypothetical protein